MLGKRKYAAGNDVTHRRPLALRRLRAHVKGASPSWCEGFPNLERWAQEIGARPAIQRALKF